jgi:starch-binding outer membrane protein, SusD/RagB family
MKSIYLKIMLGLILVSSSCTKLDQISPNSATDQQVLTTREGIIALSIGLRQFYSTVGLSNVLLLPAVTSREAKGVATFTNTLELEAGGTALPTANGSLLSYWSAMQREMSMCESIIDNAPKVTTIDAALLSGILAHAYLFKAAALSELGMAFEQVNLSTSATEPVNFLPRAQVFAESLRLLDLGVQAVAATAPSTDFTTLVSGTEFDLINSLYAYQARINLIAGNYQAAIDAADLVDLSKKSAYSYSALSRNPLDSIYHIVKSYAPRANFGLPAGLYETGDQRLGFFLTAPGAVVNADSIVTLAGFGAAQTTSIPVYLTDEIKLIKAESILRLDGSATDAVNLINEVRTQTTGDPFGVNAGLPAYSGAMTKDDLLLEVYRQRCAELYMSGLKWEDTRRFNRPEPPADNSERNRIFYPYPDQERINNPNAPADPAI